MFVCLYICISKNLIVLILIFLSLWQKLNSFLNSSIQNPQNWQTTVEKRFEGRPLYIVNEAPCTVFPIPNLILIKFSFDPYIACTRYS